MVEHATELLTFSFWVLCLVGSGVTAVAWWGFKTLLARFNKQDVALEGIRGLVESEVRQLREMHHDMDKRLTRIETACDLMEHPIRRRTDYASE